MRNIHTIFALLILSLWPSLFAKAATETKLVIKMTSSDSVAYNLVEKPTVRFTNEKLEIDSKSFSKSIDNIVSLKFLPSEVSESSSGSVAPDTTIPVGNDYVPRVPDYDQTPKNDPFPVVPTSITMASITLSRTQFDYTGSEIKPTVTVTYDNEVLTEGTDYTVAYSNNINPGEATVTIVGKGNYTDSVIATFTITIQPTFIVSINEQNVKPELTQEYGVTSATYYTSSGTVLLSNYYALPGETVTVWLLPADGYWTSRDSVNVQLMVKDVIDLSQMSSYTYTVPASGTVEMNVNFYKRIDISNDQVTLDAVFYIYEGTPIVPVVTLKHNDVTLKAGEDYTITINDNDAIGTATLTLSGISRYVGTIETAFVIKPHVIDLSSEDIIVSFQQPLYTISGTPVTPDVTVKHGTTVLLEDTDYTIACSNNDAPGLAQLIITGMGNYTGTIDTTFVIKPLIYDLVATTVLTIDGESFAYTGQPIVPTYRLEHNGVALVEGTDFTATPTDNKDAGVAHLLIVGKGNYEGILDTTFVISKVMLTVEADALTKVYGDENPEPATTITGFVNNENDSVITVMPTVTIECQKDSPVGEYAIIVSGGEAQNYDFSYVNATLEVTPRSIEDATVTMADSVAYTGQSVLPTLTVQCGSATLIEGTDYTVTPDNNTEPGIATLTIEGQGNYFNKVDTTFVIYLRPSVSIVVNDLLIKPTVDELLNNSAPATFDSEQATIIVDNYYALAGSTVMLTVTPKSYYYIKKDSITGVDLIGADPDDLSQLRHYRFVVPDEGVVAIKAVFSVDSVALGISDSRLQNLRFEVVDGQTVRVLGARETAPVSVFDARGQQVAAEVVRFDRDIIVRLARQPQGLYIIKVNNNSFKVYRK